MQKKTEEYFATCGDLYYACFGIFCFVGIMASAYFTWSWRKNRILRQRQEVEGSNEYRELLLEGPNDSYGSFLNSEVRRLEETTFNE